MRASSMPRSVAMRARSTSSAAAIGLDQVEIEA
jgi:hypothetical protein